MRSETNAKKLKDWMHALGLRVTGPGTIYLVGGASAVFEGWRSMTVDIDLEADPEPSGLFEAIAELKDSLDLNVELASPRHFLPQVPGWRERSPFLMRCGKLNFHHYDFVSQALAKLERSHPRDLIDVDAMIQRGLVTPTSLVEAFHLIAPEMIRFPSVDAAALEKAVHRLTTPPALLQ